MHLKKTFNYIIFIALATVLLIQCKDEQEKTPNPQITDVELGFENSKKVNLGEPLQVKATIIAEGGIDKINIEIKPKGNTLWAFDLTYTEFSGLKNLAFNQNLTIPVNADSGQYTFNIQVSDLAGNQITFEDQIQFNYVETPIIIPFEEVNGFIIDSEGEKLLATNKGVFSLNVITHEYVQLESTVELIPANDLAQYSNESSVDLWIASNLGVFNFNLNELLTTTNSPLLNNSVNRISIDHNNTIYFATHEGISIKKDNEWVTNLGFEDLYADYQITDLATASNGFTYVTTLGGGVERFKVDVDGISGATVFDSDWSKLKSNNVLTVFIDDTLQAFGTDMGVAMHYSEYTKWDWENYTTADGLISDTVLSIIKDNSNNWWFGTVKGLSKLDGENWTSYTAEIDGFKSNTIKFMAIDADGSLWIASDNGLSHFKNNSWTNY